MDDLSNPAETPRADPHAGCCGGRGLDTPGYPISEVIGPLPQIAPQKHWVAALTEYAKTGDE